jgi:transcriptional regulator with GAF, ATPase, and Fis domain/DNA-binding NarL/FixJ family response regulator
MIENVLIVEDEFIVANDLTIILQDAGYQVCGTADTVGSAIIAIEKLRPTWVLLDIFLQNNQMGTELAPLLHQKGIGFIYISANTNQSILEIAKSSQPYGFLVKPFRVNDLLIMLDIARSRHEISLQFATQREFLLLQQVRGLGESATPALDKLANIPTAFQSLIPFDYLAFHYQASEALSAVTGAFYRVGFDEYKILPIVAGLPNDLFLLTDKNENATLIELTSDLQQIQTSSLTIRYNLKTGLQFHCRTNEGQLELAFFNKNTAAYDHSHISMLYKTDKSILKAFGMLQADQDKNKQIRRARRHIPLPTAAKFDGIYGNSAALLHVLDNIELVANTPASVLILGESGTGKEKVAHNIHRLSSRAQSAFVTVNCAAVPAELIESELFGHEKGAFTGAVEKRIGKFELAHQGTLFLDEIGELPLAAQVKLLRVLQERQVEPVGSNKMIKVDIRIIAATNKNLEKAVSDGLFRLDLFYRINVYPIQLPPLRDRKEDIPLLAEHFLIKSAASMSRDEIPILSTEALKQLSEYNWPGNIRELEHLMERTLIKTRHAIVNHIEIPETTQSQVQFVSVATPQKTLEQMEKEHILFVLNSCKGKITGIDGAAEILALPPSTLTSKMKKLGISKDQYHHY